MTINPKQIEHPEDVTKFLRGDATWGTPEAAQAVPGVSVEMLNKTPTGTYSTTSGSWVDVDAGSGVLSQTFTVPTAGEYLLMFNVSIYATTSWLAARFRLVLDALGTPQYAGSDDAQWSMVVPVYSAGIVEYKTFIAKVSLTAGSHTIKPQWKRVDGTGTITVDSSNAFFVQGTLVAGSGVGGDIITDLAGATTATLAAASTTYDLKSAIINCLAGERPLVTVTGVWRRGSNTTALHAELRVFFDGTLVRMVDQKVSALSTGSTGTDRENASMSVHCPAATAGSHTISVKVTTNSDHTDTTAVVEYVYGTVAQYRGTAVLGTNATSGGSRVVLASYTPGGNRDKSNGTWATVGEPEGQAATSAITVPMAGKYRVQLRAGAFLVALTTGSRVEFRLNFDKGTANEQTVGTLWHIPLYTTAALTERDCFFGEVTLTAGEHTAAIEWRLGSGTDTARINGHIPFEADATAVSGSGVGGVLSTRTTGTVASVTGTQTPWSPQQVSALTQTVTTAAGERLLITLDANAGYVNGADHTYVWLFIDNAGTAEANAKYTVLERIAANYEQRNLSFSYVTDALTAGSHTVYIYVGKYDASNNWSFRGDLQVTLFRGGLVPVQKDSVQVLSTPRAFDFQGPVSVSDVAGVATIKMDPAVTAPGNASDIEESPSTVTVNSDSGWTAISPTASSWSLTALQAGLHRIDWDMLVFVVYNSTNVTFEFKIVVDEGTSNEQTIGGGAGLWRYRTAVGNDTLGTYYPMHRSELLTLAAGVHTFKGYCRGTGAAAQGSIAVNAQGGTRIALTAITGSGAGGVLQTLLTNIGNVTVNTTEPSWQTLGTVPTINCVPGEYVDVHLLCQGRASSAATTFMRVRVYDPVSGNIAVGSTHTSKATDEYVDVGFAWPMPVGSGAHDLQLQAQKWTGSATDWVVNFANLRVSQYRGGLVPFKQDNALVQDKPQAINAIGPGLQATNVAGQVNLSVQSAAEGVKRDTTALGSNQAISSTANPPTVAVPNLGTLTIACVPGEVVDLRCNGNGYGTGTTTGLVTFAVDGTALRVGSAAFGASVASGAAAEVSFDESFVATAAQHVISLLASSPSGLFTFYAGVAITALRYRGGYVQPENTPILSYNSASVINVAAAPGASSELSCQLNDGIRRRATAPLTINLATSGEGGLDTGTEAVSTWYYCYLIPKASDDTQLMALCSVTPPSTGPTGYSKWKYLGAVYNNSSGDIKVWYQLGSLFDYGSEDTVLSLTAGTDGSPVSQSLAAFIPATASRARLAYRSYGGSLTLHVGTTSGAYTVAGNSANYDNIETQIPTPDTPKVVGYRRWSGFNSGDIWCKGWVDGYLASPQSALQAKYVADTKSPKGTWATATTVNFAARPGQPTFSRLTLQDGKARVAASSTLAWAIANGVADLGYDEAASQGNTKCLYFYAVPKSGDDNQFTIRASDNPPTTGPTGYTNWKLVWATYIDGSGNLLEVTQSGNKFVFPIPRLPFDSAGADGSVQTLNLTELPISAGGVDLGAFVVTSSSWGELAIWQYGYTSSYQQLDTYVLDANDRNTVYGLVPVPETTKRIQYQRTTGGTISACRIYMRGWTDEWIDADGSSGNVIAGSDPDAIHDNVAGEISALTEKTTPVAADHLLLEDSAAGNAKKRAQVGNLPVPTHATSHKNGGGDEVAVATAAANAIPKAGAGSKLDVGWLPTSGTPTQVAPAAATGSGSSVALIDHVHSAMPLPGGAPYGFENRTDSEISFNDTTREFKIQPKSPATEWAMWSGLNTKIVKTTAQTVEVPDTVGRHYIYFTSGGTLTESGTFPGFNSIFVALVYWDGDKNVGVADERHMTTMDYTTHGYLHATVGTRYQSGLSLTQLAVGSGSLDTHAQVSLDGGTIWDEDISAVITRAATPANPFEQELGLSTSVAGKFPIYYRTGASGPWTKATTTDFPVRPFNGTPGSRVGYNLNTGGTWSVADPGANGDRVAVWLLATTSITEPVVAVMGQRSDGTLNNALANNLWESMSLGDLPFQESKILFRLIFRTSTAYGNTIKAYVEHVQDIRSVSNLPSGTYVASDHGSLSGRTAPNAHPATSISTDTTSFDGILTATETDVQLALNAIVGKIKMGTGSPEGVVTAPVGSLYLRTDGGTGTTLYLKETGSGNTGWVVITAPSVDFTDVNNVLCGETFS